MKDKENNKTEQTLTKAGKALSDIDLDPVSGGMHLVPGGTIPKSVIFIYCNNCYNEVCNYPHDEECPVADGSICPACHQPIILSKCRTKVRF